MKKYYRRRLIGVSMPVHPGGRERMDQGGSGKENAAPGRQQHGGFPVADRPRTAAGPFHPGDTVRSRKTGGTGIGLSTAKSVADMCHGDITVSYLGSSMFQVAVHLPLAAA